MSQSDTQYENLTLSVRLLGPLFPFDPIRFGRALRDQAWLLSDQFPRAAPVGARVVLEGVVARKGDVGILLHSERLQLGVVAADTDSLVSEFLQMEAIIRKEFRLDLRKNAYFYEFIAGVTIKTSKSPLTQIQSNFTTTGLFQKLGEALGSPVAPFGLRIALSDEPPNQPRWMEIKIEPDVLDPHDLLSADTVMRDPDRDTVVNFVKRFDKTVTAIAGILEQ